MEPMSNAGMPGRVAPFVGALLISVSGFTIIFWTVGRMMPWFFYFLQSRWSGLLPAVSALLIAVGSLARYRHRRAASDRR